MYRINPVRKFERSPFSNGVNRLFLYVVIISLTLIRVTILHNFAVSGLTPDILITALLFFGLSFGEKKGLEAGLVAGFLNDVLSAVPFGVYFFGYGLIGFFSGLISKRFYKESFLTQFIFSFLAAFLFSLFSFAVKSYRLCAPVFIPDFAKRIFLHSAYTGAVAPLFFLILFKILKFKEARP